VTKGSTVNGNLLPCHYCGAKKGKVIRDLGDHMSSDRRWTVYCNSCGNNSAESYGPTREAAIKNWNKDQSIEHFKKT
jgi:hypothetical protein